MKYYIIAGEASGDLHASNLMKSIKKQDGEADFRCWGGDLMENEGAVLVKHYRDLAFMGFAEVLMNLRTILRNLSFCRQDIMQYNPDVLILIDYPGFNLRMARFASENGIRVFYYISPQIWAWKKSRVHKIKKYVERMYVILPFEKKFYERYHYEVDFVGHPLLDAIDTKPVDKDEIKKQLGLNSKAVIALLPGSRKQEISKMLPLMVRMAERFQAYQFVIAGAPSQGEELYMDLIGQSGIKVIRGRMHDVLHIAEAALVTSGTATLETALFRVPEVVCYKGSWLSYRIARWLVRDINYISLVNLIMDRELVTELIQGDFNSGRLEKELRRILTDKEARSEMLEGLDQLRQVLGGPGASEHAAGLMLARLAGPGAK